MNYRLESHSPFQLFREKRPLKNIVLQPLQLKYHEESFGRLILIGRSNAAVFLFANPTSTYTLLTIHHWPMAQIAIHRAVQ